VPVRKAVIPAAGLGTRILPATKAIPKELLTLVDRPMIQYAVEEAAAAGITDVVIVTSPDKQALIDHFSPAPALERELEQRKAGAARSST
jgi:UTP--glucose-1-phosphate uridylyltransferase